MTTHDQHNEVTPPLEQVEPATPGDVNLNWPRRDGCSWPHLSGGK